MADQPPKDIILEYLRRLDDRTRSMQLDIDELKSLLGIIRSDVGVAKKENDHFYQLFARITDRLERIETRLTIKD